jgi:hypothetical protein
MRLAGGDVRISWLRCARLGGDAWAGEPPLGEEAESYRLQILSGGAPVRTFETSAPEQIYALTDQIADFGSPPTEIRVVCLQISARFGAGRVRDSLLQL